MVPISSQRLFTSKTDTADLSPEALLQVLAARVRLSHDAAARMRVLLRGAIDWRALSIDSGKLGIQPLLHKHLSGKEFVDYLPPTILGSFADAYRKQAVRGLRIEGLLDRMFSAFEQAGVTAIPLKGAFLGKWIYRDPALRPMGDIDILCRVEEEALVKAKLSELGFHQQSIYPSPFHERHYAIVQGGHLNPFFGAKPLMIEVHFSIFPDIPDGFSLMGQVWEHTRKHSTNGVPLTCLAPADLLLYLCLHLQRHLLLGQSRLYWFCDLHEVIGHYGREIEWERVFSTAASLEATEPLHRILRSLVRYWESDVPAIPESSGELPMATILGRQLHEEREERQRAVIRGQLAKLAMTADIQGWQNRAYFLWKLAFPSRENLVSRYQPRNALTLCCFCLLHPFVLAARAMASLFHYLSRAWRRQSH